MHGIGRVYPVEIIFNVRPFYFFFSELLHALTKKKTKHIKNILDRSTFTIISHRYKKRICHYYYPTPVVVQVDILS